MQAFVMYSVYYLCQKQKCIILHNVSFVDMVYNSKFMSFVNKNTYNICRIMNNTV